MNSNQIYACRGLYILASMAFLFGIYILFMTPGLTGSALVEGDKNGEHSRLVKLDLPSSSASGTVLSVIGQLVIVQGMTPRTISLVYVNRSLPVELASGKTVNVRGEFKNGLIYMDNITITGDILWAVPFTAPQPLGLIDHVIFFIAYMLL